MLIKAGFEIAYRCPDPTPMLLMLSLHPSRLRDLARRSTSRSRRRSGEPITSTASATSARGSSRLKVSRRSAPSFSSRIPACRIPSRPTQSSTRSKNCPRKRSCICFKAATAIPTTCTISPGSSSATRPSVGPRVQAICDYVHERITFGYRHACATATARDAHVDQKGVCRDFAHLAITFCRCMNIPARYCTGYLGDIGVPAVPDPMDFSAWFEAYLGGRWYTFDARHNKPRIGRILMARGRDATDVAISTSFGPTRSRRSRWSRTKSRLRNREDRSDAARAATPDGARVSGGSPVRAGPPRPRPHDARRASRLAAFSPTRRPHDVEVAARIAPDAVARLEPGSPHCASRSPSSVSTLTSPALCSTM